jgi:hypothetical protein
MRHALETREWAGRPLDAIQGWSEERFIRHPAGFPTRLRRAWRTPGAGARVQGSGLGLLLRTRRYVRPGTSMAVAIDAAGERHGFEAEVVVMRQQGSRFEVGLWMSDEDSSYRLRMVEQVCHIEAYRRRVEREEGRSLSSEAAALEWIERYAGSFPSL